VFIDLDYGRRQGRIVQSLGILLTVMDGPVQEIDQRHAFLPIGETLVYQNVGEARDGIGLRVRRVHNRNPDILLP